jgi:hypothetical protein
MDLHQSHDPLAIAAEALLAERLDDPGASVPLAALLMNLGNLLRQLFISSLAVTGQTIVPRIISTA